MKHLDVFTADPTWVHYNNGSYLGMRIKNLKDDGVVWLGKGVMKPAWDDKIPYSGYIVLFNLGEVLEEAVGKL